MPGKTNGPRGTLLLGIVYIFSVHAAQNLQKKHDKPSILIVDDEEEICALTTKILQKMVVR